MSDGLRDSERPFCDGPRPIKVPIEIGEDEMLRLPLPGWIHEKGLKYWLLGMNAEPVEDAVKLTVLLTPRKEVPECPKPG